MMIHSQLLTHDGVGAGFGKVLDLGFNGDFDLKNNAWNMVFIAFPAIATASAAVTVKVITDNTKSNVTAAATPLATIVVPANVLKAGGAFGVKMPTGIKRFWALKVETSNVAETVKFTAGITDIVDTDCNPGIDWTYYKAATAGVGQPGRIERAAELINDGVTAAEAAAAAEDLDTAAIAAHLADDDITNSHVATESEPAADGGGSGTGT